MIAAFSKIERKQDRVMPAWNTTYEDSGALAHMVLIDDAVLSMKIKEKLSSASIGKASNEVVNVRREGTSELQLAVGTEPVKLNPVLRVPEIAHNLLSVAALCNNGHSVQDTKNSRVIKMKRNIVTVDRRTNGMYAVDFHIVEEQQTVVVSEKEVSALNVWYARIVHASYRPFHWMAYKDVVWDMDMGHRSVLEICFPCINRTMTNTPMPSRARTEVRPGAVIHTDVTFMNVLSIGPARYFVIFIHESSGTVSAFHMKSRGQAAERLKCHLGLVK